MCAHWVGRLVLLEVVASASDVQGAPAAAAPQPADEASCAAGSLPGRGARQRAFDIGSDDEYTSALQVSLAVRGTATRGEAAHRAAAIPQPAAVESAGTPPGTPESTAFAQTLQRKGRRNAPPAHFLIISSPSEKKVVWTTLHEDPSRGSIEGRALPLVTSGLVRPMGIAVDRKNGFLYVADAGQKKIFSFHLAIETVGNTKRLIAPGQQDIVCEGHAVESLTIDHAGNLFFSAPASKSINKISADVMKMIRLGHIQAGSLTVVSEKNLEEEEQAAKTLAKVRQKEGPGPTNAPKLQPHILATYEAKHDPQVSHLGSILADGDDLYWTNEKDGKKFGTVVKGEVDTHEHAAAALTKVSNGAYGLAKAHGTMFFTRNGTVPGTGLVTGFLLSDATIVLNFASSLARPRGLAFDGDETMYVADEASGRVYSFPAGVMMTDAPLAATVPMDGAHGLLFLSAADPCFQKKR